MIEPMIRYNFLLYHSDVEKFMNRLQDLGVVDITATDWEASEEQQSAITLAERYKAIYREMISVDAGDDDEVVPYPTTGEAVEAFERASQERENIRILRAKAETELDELAVWGEFDPGLIRRLRDEEGITLRFFETSARQYRQEWEDDYPIEVIARPTETSGKSIGDKDKNRRVYFVLVQTREMTEDQNFTAPPDTVEHKAPEMTYGQKERQIGIYLQEEQSREAIMARAALSGGVVWEEYLEMKDTIHFTEAVHAGEEYADGLIKIIEGWSVTTDRERVEELANTFQGDGVIYTSEAGLSGHNPPIKLKNRFFPQLFELIGSLYMTPKYNELDLTPYFAPFYLLFFGMCLGDAGYGALFILLPAIGWKKIPQRYRRVGWLAIFLGISTLFWGLLTGNAFGIELIKVEALSGFSDYIVQTESMFYVALALGGAQILTGQTIKIFNKAKQGGGFKYALSQVGWVVLLLTGLAAFLPDFPGLQGFSRLPDTVSYGLFGTAALLILFFNSPGRNPFVNFGAGLYDCYNMATGLIGDLMSYIRLFALALSGSIIAQVFNALAEGLGLGIPVPGLNWLVFLLIILIGHGLTIFVSVLGAFVHPVRLTFVEFYKNAGFEGGGRDFNPLKRYKDQTK